MFFKLDQYDKTEKAVSLSKGTSLLTENLEYSEFIASVLSETGGRGVPCSEISFTHGFPKRIKDKICEYSPSDEAYAIEIGKKTKPDQDRKLTKLERERMIEQLTAEMRDAAKRLEFEQAAFIRDRIKELRGNR